MTTHYSALIGAARFGGRSAAEIRLYSDEPDDDKDPCTTLVLVTGAAFVQIYPAPAELRAMAAEMLAAADRAEEVARGFQPGARKSAEVPA